MAKEPVRTVGKGSFVVEFSHREVGTLRVLTGMDSVSWAYSLNVANWNTYGGQVSQILSCYVENLTVEGTLANYADLETVASYFLSYFQVASQGDNANPIPGKTSYNQEPMTMSYPKRGWEFEIMPLKFPAFRVGREVVAPTWKIIAHIVDDSNDVDELSDLIVAETEIKAHLDTDDTSLDTNFGLTGVIKFVDENPFSDPFTDKGTDFANKTLSDRVDQLSNWYNSLLPAYLQGDYDAIMGEVGSKPAFGNRDIITDQESDLQKKTEDGLKDRQP